MDTTQTTTDEQLAAFLQELTELSRRHGLGINGGTLWEMQSGTNTDYTRTYSVNDESELEFA